MSTAQVVGCIVHDSTVTASTQHLTDCIAAFILNTIDRDQISNLNEQGTVFVEAPRVDMDTFGTLMMFKLSVGDIAAVKAIFRGAVRNEDSSNDPEDEPSMFLVIGCKNFCKEVLEFLFMDRNGEVSEKEKSVIEALSGCVSGTVIASKSWRDELFRGNIVDMYTLARAKISG